MSQNHSSIRFTITVLQSYEQIEKMVTALNEVFKGVLDEKQYTFELIYNAFKIAGWDSF